MEVTKAYCIQYWMNTCTIVIKFNARIIPNCYFFISVDLWLCKSHRYNIKNMKCCSFILLVILEYLDSQANVCSHISVSTCKSIQQTCYIDNNTFMCTWNSWSYEWAWVYSLCTFSLYTYTQYKQCITFTHSHLLTLWMLKGCSCLGTTCPRVLENAFYQWQSR